MLVIPQRVSNGFISFNLAGSEAKWNIVNREFESGKKYEYTLLLDFPEVEVFGESISEWGDGREYHVDSKLELGTEIDVINSLVRDNLLVKIAGDTYLIGSPQGVGLPNEWPQHQAGIGTFWITPYEITNKQYVSFLNAKGFVNDKLLIDGTGDVLFDDSSSDKWSSKEGREYYPVTNVTWYGAREFARWLGGDLPTEREWETACRAGSEGLFSFDFDDSNRDDIKYYVNCKERDSIVHTISPGTMIVNDLKPNKYGLYNMHGNVSEWCLDAVERSSEGSPAPYYRQGNIVLEQNDETLRVIRGGSWKSSLEGCRSAFRSCLLPTHALDVVGFRVVFPIKNILKVKVENLKVAMSSSVEKK
jgi:formylglycine-generating enzyme required for sulfatase activity